LHIVRLLTSTHGRQTHSTIRSARMAGVRRRLSDRHRAPRPRPRRGLRKLCGRHLPERGASGLGDTFPRGVRVAWETPSREGCEWPGRHLPERGASGLGDTFPRGVRVGSGRHRAGGGKKHLRVHHKRSMQHAARERPGRASKMNTVCESLADPCLRLTSKGSEKHPPSKGAQMSPTPSYAQMIATVGSDAIQNTMD